MKGGFLLVNEELSRRAVALSVKTSKLSAQALAYVLRAAGRKIQKTRQTHKTPQGRQTVKQLMRHGASTNSLEITGAPRDFDRVARRWNVDYAFYKTGPKQYLLFFKSGQADAITACFSEYSKRVLHKSKSRRAPIRDQLDRAMEQTRKQQRRHKERSKEVELDGR